MKRIKIVAAVAIAAAAISTPAMAKKKDVTYVMVNEEMGVPVFPYDITDKPYKIIGVVTAGVRKATIFSKEPSQQKIYNEIWERGEKLGADAVIGAKYGDSHVTALSWGNTKAGGVAIKFLTAEEIAAGTKGDTLEGFDPEAWTGKKM
ncbi:hypothetical protein [Sphingopyxis macrogoltabida]|uniref:hypothetical protein n=2 Tax=Sphingopyxis macrogoltabida TaxID=33050 RepID=UPI0006ED1D43|nr:hypothetical protein [Sphingopyxis macrogoltabida]ALJ11866.1 hypothetical protein LH19_03195 [Sphingopyxis macrogoltabida]